MTVAQVNALWARIKAIFATKTEVSGKQDTLTFDTTPTASSANPVTSGGVYTALGTKQATLVSGTNIKTVNSQSLLGSGDITIEAGSSDRMYSSTLPMPALGTYSSSVHANSERGFDVGWEDLSSSDLGEWATFIGTWLQAIKEDEFDGRYIFKVSKSGLDTVEIRDAWMTTSQNGSSESERSFTLRFHYQGLLYNVNGTASGWYHNVTINTNNSGTALIPNNLAGKDELATVATSGSYNDLSNKPTIPDDKVFVATYGSTTASEIASALSANKEVIAIKDNIVYNYLSLSSNTYYFIGWTLKDRVSRISCDSNGWNSVDNINIEDKSNKVTSLSSSSTDSQYPSAACVWGLIGDVETLLAAI